MSKEKVNIEAVCHHLFDADADLVPLENAISLVYVIAEAMEFGHASASEYVEAVCAANDLLSRTFKDLKSDVNGAFTAAGYQT